MAERYDLPLPAWILRSFTFLMLAFLVVPALTVIPVSFSSGTIIGFRFPGYSTGWYSEVVTAPAWQAGIVNSLIIGCSATLLSTVIGTLGALGIRRLTPRMRIPMLVLALFPLMVPIVIIALGGYLAMVKAGLNNTYWAAIILHAMLGLPFVAISVLSALEGFDENLWRAAASLGARPGPAFRRVMLPLILPGVVTGAVFAFAISLDEVVVASFVTAPAQKTIPLVMFSGIKENTGPIVTAAATLLLLLSVLFLGAIELLRRRSERLALPSSREASWNG
jgi:putative spermidine/putrescine transport system permease protein